ncbi:phage tail protein [Ferrimonas pelagia]|uniref:Tail fiber protein n=1 Tax=Ferrimonas pelagia TaxID=1177826 RepID=A0ABP9EHS3_9GAMM
MAEPFQSEIKMFGFNFAPRGWAQCDGQILPISQNPALYSLIGTQFGGDGRTSFALPDMRSRVPLGQGDLAGQQFVAGVHHGVEAVTLTQAELAGHSHSLNASASTGTQKIYENSVFGSGSQVYSTKTPNVALNPTQATSVGGGASHNNMQPTQVVNYCIALTGLFPSRN